MLEQLDGGAIIRGAENITCPYCLYVYCNSSEYDLDATTTQLICCEECFNVFAVTKTPEDTYITYTREKE